MIISHSGCAIAPGAPGNSPTSNLARHRPAGSGQVNPAAFARDHDGVIGSGA